MGYETMNKFCGGRSEEVSSGREAWESGRRGEQIFVRIAQINFFYRDMRRETWEQTCLQILTRNWHLKTFLLKDFWACSFSVTDCLPFPHFNFQVIIRTHDLNWFFFWLKNNLHQTEFFSKILNILHLSQIKNFWTVRNQCS